MGWCLRKASGESPRRSGPFSQTLMQYSPANRKLAAGSLAWKWGVVVKVIPRGPDWKLPAGDPPSPPAQATSAQPTRRKSLDTAVAASMRSSENSHTARRAKPSRNVTTVYGKYIGRVGALAVALGIGGAIATTPGVAWADGTSSESNSSATSSESNSSESNSSESNSSESNSSSGSSSSSVGQAPKASSAASTDESESSADESDTSKSSETITTHESGVVVRTSGGPDTSDITGADSSTDDDTPTGTRSRHARPLAATDSLTASTKAGANILRPRSSGGTSVRLAPADTAAVRLHTATARDGQAADQTNQPPTTTFTPKASTSNAPKLVQTAIEPADTPMSKPAKLVAAALESLLDPGPKDPPDSPVLLALLAWARRQSIQEVAGQTRVPSSMQTAQIQPQSTAEASPAVGEVSPAAGVNALQKYPRSPTPTRRYSRR